MKVKIDALDITVLKGGAADDRQVGQGPRLPAPARRARGPRLLREAQPDLPRRGVRRRRGRRRAASRSATGRPSTSRSRPTNPWVPLRILALGKTGSRAGRRRRLPPDRPRPGAAAGADRRRTASASMPASAWPTACSDDLRSDRGMEWVPTSGWLTKVAVDGTAARADLRPRGRRRPARARRRAVDAGLALPADPPVQTASTWPAVDRPRGCCSAVGLVDRRAVGIVPRRQPPPARDEARGDRHGSPAAGAGIARSTRDPRARPRGRARSAAVVGASAVAHAPRPDRDPDHDPLVALRAGARSRVPVGRAGHVRDHEHRPDRSRVDRRRRRAPRAAPDRHRAVPQRPPDRDLDPGRPRAQDHDHVRRGRARSTYICHLPGHEAYGMVGVLSITPGGWPGGRDPGGRAAVP